MYKVSEKDLSRSIRACSRLREGRLRGLEVYVAAGFQQIAGVKRVEEDGLQSLHIGDPFDFGIKF